MSMQRVVLTVAAYLLLVPGVTQAQDRWVAPVEAKRISNPLPKSEEVLGRGRQLYDGTAYSCKDCHNRQSRGDGIAASAFNPRPPDLTSTEIQAQTDGELFWKIKQGRNAMPAYGRHPDEDRWALVLFIRTLKQAEQ